VGRRLGGGGGALSNIVFPGSAPSRQQYREAYGSGIVLEYFWLWGSLDRQGASWTVIPSSSSPGRECGLLDPFDDIPFATNNVRPAQRGAAVSRAVDNV
jgi:hypothetical protein